MSSKQISGSERNNLCLERNDLGTNRLDTTNTIQKLPFFLKERYFCFSFAVPPKCPDGERFIYSLSFVSNYKLSLICVGLVHHETHSVFCKGQLKAFYIVGGNFLL